MELVKSSGALPEVLVLRPKVFADARGYFFESYNQEQLAALGVRSVFVQDNHSHSRRGVLRGMHYQLGRPQAKLVRVTSGRVVDVVVDVRRGSPTFGRWIMQELSSENHYLLYAPEGFAHGFLVLSEEADFQYKCSDFYAPEEERGILWSDPQLVIPWPLAGLEPTLNDRDAAFPTLDQARPEDLPIFQELAAP